MHKIKSYGLERSQFVLQSAKIWSNGLERESIEYTIQKSVHMVLKGDIWLKKSVYMVLKGVNCVHNTNIRSNGLERRQLCTH